MTVGASHRHIFMQISISQHLITVECHGNITCDSAVGGYFHHMLASDRRILCSRNRVLEVLGGNNVDFGGR